MREGQALSAMDVYFVARVAFMEMPDVRLFTRPGAFDDMLLVIAERHLAREKWRGIAAVGKEAMHNGDLLYVGHVVRDLAARFQRLGAG